jgi:hypothetical protein
MNANERRWYLRPDLWLEVFVLVNLGFLSLDIYLAHSMNRFRERAEYVPLYFSLLVPPFLLAGLILRERLGRDAAWRDVGYLIGWLAILIGLMGTVLHLQDRFFVERTLRSLVYAAPFAAPLAYTGLGLLLILNRMVDARSEEWARWVVLLALGGFVGNFIFSLTDHAQNGFHHFAEWIAVGVSALAVGGLLSLFCAPVSRGYLLLCGGVLGLQVLTGLLGFFYHVRADVNGPSLDWFENIVHGAPVLAPLLFPNLALLAGIGLYALAGHVPSATLEPSTPEVAMPAAAQVDQTIPL